MVGRNLGNFRVERLLGQGGMAQVYYGWDESLERPVAIKVLDERVRDDPAYAGRFLQEARAIANWRHENIVQVYYAGQDNGVYFFAMEYVEGTDLGTLLAEYATAGELIPHDELLKIGRAVAAALDYAHQRQVIHRDVKPANVLLDADGRVLLADFGLALNVKKGTLGETFGTPHYIAPEQARNSADAVAASDLYALGVVLYEMLTGVVPFDDPSPTSVALQHLTMPPPPPRALNPELNPAVEEVLLRALSKDPAARYDSGSDLIAALEAALAMPTTAQEEAQWQLPPLPAGVAAPTPRSLSQTSVADRLSMMAPESLPLPTPPLPPSEEASASLPWGRSLLVVAGLGLLLVFLLFIISRLPGEDQAQPATVPAVVAGDRESPVPTPPTPTTPAATATVATATPAVVVDSPVASPTPLPASPTATSSPVPSPAPTGQSDLTPTIAFPDGQRVQMFYDADSFYLWNPGGDRIAFVALVFEALNPEGQPAGYRFEGSQWAATGFDALLSNGCAGLKAFEASEQPPSRCVQVNSLRAPTLAQIEAEVGFWLSRPNVNTFRILWNEGEVARCKTGAQTCEVFLPPPS